MIAILCIVALWTLAVGTLLRCLPGAMGTDQKWQTCANAGELAQIVGLFAALVAASIAIVMAT